ncbi:hypothetical protein ANO11243_064910 [Dothideomycetidae sp. 11243]|nr:hypothetical protein ANO11243_064910 [fungal sp. No.11243]
MAISARPPPPPPQPSTPAAATPTPPDFSAAQRAASQFVPNPARAHSQTFFRQPGSYTAPSGTPLSSSALGEQYAATLRGGGPQMFEDYAVEGEDLDWTKVTDPRERKRLQNIINGRKYRERRLAQEGDGGSLSPGPNTAPGTPVPPPQMAQFAPPPPQPPQPSVQAQSQALQQQLQNYADRQPQTVQMSVGGGSQTQTQTQTQGGYT